MRIVSRVDRYCQSKRYLRSSAFRFGLGPSLLAFGRFVSRQPSLRGSSFPHQINRKNGKGPNLEQPPGFEAVDGFTKFRWLQIFETENAHKLSSLKLSSLNNTTNMVIANFDPGFGALGGALIGKQ